MSAKTYILQQPLPDSKIGDEYIWNESMKAYYKNGNVQESFWIGKYIEENESWFKLKKEIVTGLIGVYIKGNIIKYENSASLKLDENGKPTAIAINGIVFLPAISSYTEQDMRNCFESARLMTRCESAMCRVYKDFDEYLKLITE